MERWQLDSVESCNQFLRENQWYANGKNFSVSHLYATSAQSRWAYENLWGVYFTKPHYTWMALWMAITSRTRLPKRRILYWPPAVDQGDFIGRIAVHNPTHIALQELVVEQAYIYLFDPRRFLGMPMFRISHEAKAQKLAALGRLGFQSQQVHRRGRNYDALVSSLDTPALVDIDEWQVALIGREEEVPDVEVLLTPTLVRQLTSSISHCEQEVGEDYIVHTSKPHP